MIKLRRVALDDISVKYARDLGSNKLKHYVVSYVGSIILNKTYDELVLDFVSKELNIPTTEIEILDGLKSAPNEALVEEATDVLEYLPKIKKALKKVKTNSQLYQYNKRTRFWLLWTLLYPLASILNPLLRRLDGFYWKHQWKKGGGVPEDRFEYLSAVKNIKHIREIPTSTYVRHVEPCHYLSVEFEEQDRDKAVKILQEDLKILQNHKLIIGHLQMPFTMKLPDSIGSGHRTMILACFLFIDSDKFYKIVNKTPFDVPYLALNKLLGLKTENFEGSATALPQLSPRNKYEIEQISVCPSFRKEAQEEHVKVYLESVEAGKRIAAKKKEEVNMDKKLIINSDGKQPAFPVGSTERVGDISASHVNGGLTKREYFAACAMQELLSHGKFVTAEILAKASVNYADALLVELARTEE